MWRNTLTWKQVHWRWQYQGAQVSGRYIFVVFAGKVFQQIVGIQMGTNCAPLLADIFLYSYEAEFIQCFLSSGRKELASRFNFTYRYIDDVLSINNPEFENYLGQIYPVELEVGKVGPVNQVNQTNRMDVVRCHLIDRPQSVPQLSCNRTLQFSKRSD